MMYTTTERDRSEALLRSSAVGLALAFFAGVVACAGEDGELPVADMAIAEMEAPAAPVAIEATEAKQGSVTIQAEQAQSLADTTTDAPAPIRDASPGDDEAVAPSDSYSLGIAAWRGGDPQGAEEHLRVWVAQWPDHAKGRVNLARALIETGRPHEAREHAGIATDLDPGSAAAWRTMARAQAESGDCSSALASYEEALRVDPEDVWALNNMGYLLIEHGRFEDAIGPLALAVTLDGGNPLFRKNLLAAVEGSGRDMRELDAFVTGQLAERYTRERRGPPDGDSWPHGRGA